MADIIASLDVLSQQTGCLIDLSAILDLSICPKVDIKTQKPHTIEQKDDYVCVTSTEVSLRTMQNTPDTEAYLSTWEK